MVCYYLNYKFVIIVGLEISTLTSPVSQYKNVELIPSISLPPPLSVDELQLESTLNTKVFYYRLNVFTSFNDVYL